MPGPVSYHVGKFPPRNLEWRRLIPLIGPATEALARYDGRLSSMPNSAVLLSPLTTREAVLSSRIEGTQATMGEVLEYEADGGGARLDPEKESDIREVLNYRRAMHQAVEHLNSIPLCNRLLKTVHATLLDGVRGEGKAPGEFRKAQNCIGAPGCTLEQARFLPITPDRLEDGMAEWERYVHSKEELDLLVQLAIVHAEFESLHPFNDGNGRIGRMILPLFLYDRRLLGSPMFYLSEYLEAHREEYCDRLLAISRDDDWTGWCEFFLKALRQQAASNDAKAAAIQELYQTKKDQFATIVHSQYAVRALDWFFSRPVFKTPDFISTSGIPKPTANRLVRLARDHGLLRDLVRGSGRRPSILVFPELLNIAEGKEVF